MKNSLNRSSMKSKNCGIVQYRRFSKIYGIVQYLSFLVSYYCHFTENLRYCNSNLRYCTIPQIFGFNSCYLTKFWTVLDFSLPNFVIVIFRDVKEWDNPMTLKMLHWKIHTDSRELKQSNTRPKAEFWIVFQLEWGGTYFSM